MGARMAGWLGGFLFRRGMYKCTKAHAPARIDRASRDGACSYGADDQNTRIIDFAGERIASRGGGVSAASTARTNLVLHGGYRSW